MRYLLHTLFAFVFALPLNAQMYDPIDYSFEVKDLGENKARITTIITMEKGWHVYSVNTSKESMLMGTILELEGNSNFKLVGKVQEPTPHTEYDSNYKEMLSYHSGRIKIYQDIEKLSTKDFTITGLFGYQTCNEEMCLPPEYIDTAFKVKGAKNLGTTSGVPDKEQKAIQKKENIKDENRNTATESYEEGAGEIAEGVAGEKLEIDYDEPKDSSGEVKKQEEATLTASNPEEKEESDGLLKIFILSFLGGFAALLTPCVFPMIPLTVSFFTKQSKNRAKGIANAIIYGVSIIVLYTLIGFFITWAFGSDALNALSTNPWMNLAFFILLVVFAISFFGAFEITLPSSWVNKTDQASDKGGILGIFFMAFTLALVSFSCTGPIIGTLLVEAASGGVQGPLTGMFGFSLALALPFTLFAIFPGWLNSLPKSGGWLNSVKVFLGFIELAFAFKFLSTADLVWQAGILKREWFIAIWIAIFVLLTLYLLGKYRLPHDSPSDKISVSRLILAVVSLSFTIYLVPGLWGAPLKLISGFPPPMFYSESPQGLNVAGGTVVSGGAIADIPDGADPEHCPHQLNCFHDFETGRAYAEKVGKPILLDFTGWGCVNCRKMEEQVWSDPRVLSILSNEIVLISLYVDEREKLPKEEQYTSPITGKKIKSVGNKWSDFQIEHFKSNSQPQYIILGHNSMQPINGSTAYDPDIQLYIDWLNEGIAKFEKGA